jgi:membrane protein
MLERSRRRVTEAAERVGAWAEDRDPGSPSGVAIGAWRRYRAVDGPLQSALLSLYILVAVIPALLAIEAYLDSHPAALAERLAHHYDLSSPTAALLRGVLSQDRQHELGAAVLAVVGALVFGVGFGKVLQLVHARAWQVELRTGAKDQGLYALVLLAVYGFVLLFLVQVTELRDTPSWVKALLGLGWVGLLVAFFTWAPSVLLHGQIPRRDLLPGAVLTAVGLVIVMVVSSFVMELWINLYAKDYGGFGVVLAIYFWLAFSSAVIVWAASLSPPLSERRALKHGAPDARSAGARPL